MMPAIVSNLWTKGEWLPDPDGAVYNEGANAYMMAIIHYPPGESKSIPAYAFGDTQEQCEANAWLLASSKELFNALQKLIDYTPRMEPLEAWTQWGDGRFEAMKAIEKALDLKIYKTNG